jgi:hypothetical protein
LAFSAPFWTGYLRFSAFYGIRYFRKGADFGVFAPFWTWDLRFSAFYGIRYFRKGADFGYFAPFRTWGRERESIGARERETFQNVVYEMWFSGGCGGYGFAAGYFENGLVRVIMPLRPLECGLQ